MLKNIVKEIITSNLNGSISFPQVIKKLMAEGVESYHVDLVRSENRYYLPNGDSIVESVPHQLLLTTKAFVADEIKANIKSIQEGKIDYVTFVENIFAAGCVYYIAYLNGRKVIYFGRDGDFHIEKFPNAN